MYQKIMEIGKKTKCVFGLALLLQACMSAPSVSPSGASALNIAPDFTGLAGKDEQARLRAQMQLFPKGADLHNHLTGAIYAESWIKWAAEDGLCVDIKAKALRFPEPDCAGENLRPAQILLADTPLRRSMINALSVRDFVPYAGYSGHDQFFDTFFRIASKPERFGAMLAEVAERAEHQNIQYLELMHTLVLGELFPLVAQVNMTGDAAADYKALMASPFGAALPSLVASLQAQVRRGYLEKDRILGCMPGADEPSIKGCGVKINLIHQVIRSFEPSVVYAQLILGWAARAQIPELRGVNLVAPEDGYVALRDYDQHMKMIDYLYQNQGAWGVTLHAGELNLGLVAPEYLRRHIRDAVEIGHASRIGHGIDIAYEDDLEGLLKELRDRSVMIEINLTSNEVILGMQPLGHPLSLYRRAGVDFALSTDDEGVSRIDLSHEYQKGFTDYGLSFMELQQSARNSIAHSFLQGMGLYENRACVEDLARRLLGDRCLSHLQANEKAAMAWELETRFWAFDDKLKERGPRD